MIKLQDFARERGVTDRQIQRLLQKYAAELKGLYERKGVNGTWLTDEACDILCSKMKTPPPAPFQEDPRVAVLEQKLAEVTLQLREKDKLLTLSQKTAQEAQNKVAELLEEAAKVKALEDGKTVAEAKIEALINRNVWERITRRGEASIMVRNDH